MQANITFGINIILLIYTYYELYLFFLGNFRTFMYLLSLHMKSSIDKCSVFPRYLGIW